MYSGTHENRQRSHCHRRAKSSGVGVDQNRPESSVGNALRRLARVGVLKEIKPGSGRTPAVYQFVGPGQMSLYGDDVGERAGSRSS